MIMPFLIDSGREQRLFISYQQYFNHHMWNTHWILLDFYKINSMEPMLCSNQ